MVLIGNFPSKGLLQNTTYSRSIPFLEKILINSNNDSLSERIATSEYSAK